MQEAIAATRLKGVPNNLEFLGELAREPRFVAGATTTAFLDTFTFKPRVMEVIMPGAGARGGGGGASACGCRQRCSRGRPRSPAVPPPLAPPPPAPPGLQTSVQDWPGRVGLWRVGVPPSGPMDALAHRTANALVGNDEDAATLEFGLTGACARAGGEVVWHPQLQRWVGAAQPANSPARHTRSHTHTYTHTPNPIPTTKNAGPTIKFHCDALVALAGAAFEAALDGGPLPGGWGASFAVAAGQELRLGAVDPASGVRGYLAVAGGVDVPKYLGSRATFPSGKFGGYQGRCAAGQGGGCMGGRETARVAPWGARPWARAAPLATRAASHAPLRPPPRTPPRTPPPLGTCAPATRCPSARPPRPRRPRRCPRGGSPSSRAR